MSEEYQHRDGDESHQWPGFDVRIRWPDHTSSFEFWACHTAAVSKCRSEDYDPKADFEMDVSGFLRFDGCLNWSTSHPMMVHCCGRKEALQYGALFDAIYDYGASHGFEED